MNYKKAFFSKLQDVYLGTKITNKQNKSGFSNLLDIKQKYFKRLKADFEAIMQGKIDKKTKAS